MADVDIPALIAQRAALDEVIAAAEFDALVELVAAKDAYRADASEANRLRKAAAVTLVQQLRGHLRANRPGTRIGGDAFISTTPEG